MHKRLQGNDKRKASGSGMECADGVGMTIAITKRMGMANTAFSGEIMRFTENRGGFRHVWIWDDANGKLTYTQIKRGKHMVRVRHWASKLMCKSPVDAIRTLTPFSGPSWFGRDAINELRQAFTF